MEQEIIENTEPTAQNLAFEVENENIQTDSELEKARNILLNQLPNYLFIKIKYFEVHREKGGGLLLIGVEKNSSSFAKVKTLVDSNSDFIKSVDLSLPPDHFHTILNQYLAFTPGASKIHDATILQDKLISAISPSSFQGFFSYSSLPKPTRSATGSINTSETNLVTILQSIFETVLGEILYRRVEVEADYDFLTREKLESIGKIIEIEPTSEEPLQTEERSEPEIQHREVEVNLKGQLIIDPVSGVQVIDLEIGDTLYLDIMDRTKEAISVASKMGLYRKGLWIPARGKITDIYDINNDQRRFRVQIAKNVFLDVPVFKNVKVKVTGTQLVDDISEDKKPADTHVASPLPILIGVVLVAILVIILVMMK